MSHHEPLSRTDKENSVRFDSCSLPLWLLQLKLSHGRLEKKWMGCSLKWFPHPSRPLFFLMTSPSVNPSISVGSLTSDLWKPAALFFQGAQGATQDSWNRTEPELSHGRHFLPAQWSSEPWAPFPRPIVITKDRLSLQMCWTVKQDKNTHLP